jgi:hypothetical protein
MWLNEGGSPKGSKFTPVGTSLPMWVKFTPRGKLMFLKTGPKIFQISARNPKRQDSNDAKSLGQQSCCFTNVALSRKLANYLYVDFMVEMVHAETL